MMRLLLVLLLAGRELQPQSVPAVPTWTLSARPSLEIGDDANIQTQFNGVTGILRMPRGEIVVANGMSQELRVFSASGAYLRTLAESERGGSRLRALNRIWRSGDTVFAAEILPNESSLHRFTIAGYVGKRSVGASNAGGITPLDRFADGHLVITAPARWTRLLVTDGLYTDSIPLGVLSLEALGEPRWIGALSAQSLLIPGFGGGRGRGPRGNSVPFAFGRSELHAVSGDRLWVGDTETGIVEQFSSAGRKLGQFRLPIASRPFDTAAISRQRTSILNDAMNWGDRARLDASYSVPLPATAPRFSRFLPGVNGEMWIQLYSELTSAPRRYLVVDRTGAPVGRVTLPADLVPFEAGADYVMGIRRDQDGLERVVRYGLTRR